MAKARYFKADGKKGRARALPAELFEEDVNEAVLHRVVKALRSNARQGTASAKTRAEVEGGNSKPWKQKGTGRARQGSTRSVQWVGGGRAFPPIPHLWKQKVPKKIRLLARRSALSARAVEDRVVLIDPLDFEKPATRRLVKYLDPIAEGGKVLLLTDSVKTNVVLSARNVGEIRVFPFGQESTYDILWAGTVVIERTAIEDGKGSAEDADEGEAGDA
jgi:large subunit ribosomal protein L4